MMQGNTDSMIYSNNIDELTGIYNRRGFYSAAHNLLASQPEKHFCLIYWNIRKFKVTNELFGWEAGDKILRHWAHKLHNILQKETAIYGRLERDNFVCCVEESFLDTEDWKNLGSINYHTDETTYHFFSCCGLYRIEDPSLSIESMVDKARIAMDTIKNNYLCLYAWYTDDMWNSLLEEQQMNSDFHRGISAHEFCVYYQPICRAFDGQISGAEALVRWIRPDKGIISPDHFIPVFEKNGFISILDRYVWNEVCSMLEKRIAAGGRVVPVSINVSRVEFYNPKLCEDIYSIVSAHNIPPELIKIEITESAYADNPIKVSEAIDTLHKYGFKILMDDFGSGYSSLNMLKDLPIDILKIDMRFLDNFEQNRKASIVLESVIRLAKWMNLGIVSEGVETQNEWNYLRSVECDLVQGYYFFRPMPCSDFVQLLDSEPIPFDNLFLTDNEMIDSGVLSLFSASTSESILFYDMIGGMGIAEGDGQHLELLTVNRGFYEAIYGTSQPEYRLLHVPLPPSEQDELNKHCLASKLDSLIQRFSLYHKRQDGKHVWLDVRIRYIGGTPKHSFYFVTVDNIDGQMKQAIE